MFNFNNHTQSEHSNMNTSPEKYLKTQIKKDLNGQRKYNHNNHTKHGTSNPQINSYLPINNINGQRTHVQVVGFLQNTDTNSHMITYNRPYSGDMVLIGQQCQIQQYQPQGYIAQGKIAQGYITQGNIAQGNIAQGYIAQPFLSRVQSIPSSIRKSTPTNKNQNQPIPSSIRKVPSCLTNRGVIAYDQPKIFNINQNTEIKCRAPGCKIKHFEHYCPTCRDDNANHQEFDCPIYKH